MDAREGGTDTTRRERDSGRGERGQTGTPGPIDGRSRLSRVILCRCQGHVRHAWGGETGGWIGIERKKERGIERGRGEAERDGRERAGAPPLPRPSPACVRPPRCPPRRPAPSVPPRDNISNRCSRRCPYCAPRRGTGPGGARSLGTAAAFGGCEGGQARGAPDDAGSRSTMDRDGLLPVPTPARPMLCSVVATPERGPRWTQETAGWITSVRLAVTRHPTRASIPPTALSPRA